MAVVLVVLGFFILAPFGTGRGSSADDAVFVGGALDVNDDKKALPRRLSKEYESVLRLRVLRIRDRQRERITEGGRCLLEAHAVLAPIGLTLKFSCGDQPTKRRCR